MQCSQLYTLDANNFCFDCDLLADQKDNNY